ncbi:MAG: hypothetical protein IKD81_04210 [Eubacteriaceae bacterium]|nr:hypothetical protein [Eubacteriaceae bacterium]
MEEEKKEPSGIDINYYARKKEEIYDRLNLSLKQIDLIIVMLILLLIAAIVIGSLKGRGIL